MKKLKKHVVIGTTAGLAGLFLTACGAYGPPTYDATNATEGGSTMSITTDQEDKQNTSAAESSAASTSLDVTGSADNASSSSTVSDNASASSASSVSEQNSATGSVSFTEVEGLSGQDVIDAISSSSLVSGDFEYINPKDSPVPTVYGPPVSDR